MQHNKTVNEYKKQFMKKVRLFEEPRSFNVDDDILGALRSAYKDLTPRTLKRVDKNDTNNTIDKEPALEYLKQRFSDLLKNPNATISAAGSFDAWHKETCMGFQTEFNKAIDGIYSNIEYGKAQKIVNMTFKYLYCFECADKYIDIFKQCHMPIDSFTLNWYWKEVIQKSYNKNKKRKEKIKKDELPKSWSDMRENQYDDIQEKIKNYLKDNKNNYTKSNNQPIVLPNEPLFAEFIIWPEEMKKTAKNSVEKIINDYGDDQDFLQEILDVIQNKINIVNTEK